MTRLDAEMSNQREGFVDVPRYKRDRAMHRIQRSSKLCTVVGQVAKDLGRDLHRSEARNAAQEELHLEAGKTGAASESNSGIPGQRD